MSGFSTQDIINLSNESHAEGLAEGAALRDELAEALRPFANIAMHSGVCKAMANTLRPHERESFLAALGQAREVLAKYEAAKAEGRS